MTNAQTEARAIVEEYGKRPKTSILINLIATALAAKDAELAELRKEVLKVMGGAACEEAQRLRAEAQLAEANKALKEAADLLADLDQGRSIHNQRFPNEKIDGPLWAQIGRVVSIARRAREAQGGENG